jgi:hypothetical protein
LEGRKGRVWRVKHYIMSANHGDDLSIETLKNLSTKGLVTNEEFAWLFVHTRPLLLLAQGALKRGSGTSQKESGLTEPTSVQPRFLHLME